MSRRSNMSYHQRIAHQRELMRDLTDEAKLTGLLEARLPESSYARIVARLEAREVIDLTGSRFDLSLPADRVRYLEKLLSQLDNYLTVIDNASRFCKSWGEPGRIDIFWNDRAPQYKVHASFEVLRHMAQAAGWIEQGLHVYK